MATVINKIQDILFTEIAASDKRMEHYKNQRQCLLESTTSSLDGEIIDVPFPAEQSTSITAVLGYCKKKILNPYLRLLSFVGLRPLFTNQEPCFCLRTLNYFYTVFLIALLVGGYFLQYMACFRRDRGFCFKNGKTSSPILYQSEVKRMYEKICVAPVIYSFIVPSFLHFFGYLHALITTRRSDEEQLPVLMERVFLCSTNASTGVNSQRRLIRTLWFFVGCTCVWMILSLIAVNLMMADGEIRLKWVAEGSPLYLTNTLKVLLVICTLWHDTVQATIISNYCLQTQLLTTYLEFLQEKLLQSQIEPLDWIRHIEIFKKMLDYVNHQVAPSVGLFTFVNLSCALAGLLWFLNYDTVDIETVPIVGISTLNVILWCFLALAPFVQAARLSSECDTLRNAGQEVRTRPFVHQDTPSHELDSILLYTASLKLRAKLFYVPIAGKYLCLFFVFGAVCILVLGQCHFLTV